MTIDFVMGIIVPIIIFILGLLIFIFKRDENGMLPFSILIMSVAALTFIYGITHVNTGSRKIYNVLKEYDVEYVGGETYRKGKFEFKYASNSSPHGMKYTLKDIDDYEFDLHYDAINIEFDISYNALKEVYNYLLEYAKEIDGLASLSITRRNKKIDFTYNINTHEFKHTIIVVTKESDEKKLDNYDSLYIYPELSLKHTEENKELDEKLINLIYDMDINEFWKSKKDGATIYKGRERFK